MNEAIRPTLPQLLEGRILKSVAEALGVEQSTVSSWRHRKSRPRVEHLPKLAAYLKVDLGELAQICADTLIVRS